MSRWINLLAAALVVSSGVGAQADVVIGNFEGSDPGTWGFWNGGFQAGVNGDANLELSTADASTGSTSVLATNSGWDQNLAYQADAPTRALFADHTLLQFDVVFPESTASGWWEIFELVINTQNGGFDALPAAGFTNSSGNANGQQVGWGAGTTPRLVVTYTVDYSALKTEWAGGLPGDWLELVFSLNNDTVHTTAYIDNVRLAEVPEPASLALLGLAGLAAFARRRV